MPCNGEQRGRQSRLSKKSFSREICLSRNCIISEKRFGSFFVFFSFQLFSSGLQADCKSVWVFSSGLPADCKSDWDFFLRLQREKKNSTLNFKMLNFTIEKYS
uniref:Uncharacterized protein n=1 Tax=Cacopsylla melanoneura TaxID=428564 RepID=A0A8D9A2T1_9HEMI